jgi:RNA polymerase sigma factor (sigma-70 family)
MHRNCLSPAIRQLRDQQVRFSPHDHRVTNNGYESDPDLKFTGKEACHDLRLFVEDLSDAARVPAAAVGQRVLTVAELARQFRVSTKTVSRWRQQGLVSRRFLFDGRKRLGFLQSSVDRFVALNEEQIRRGAQFSQLTDEMRAARIMELPLDHIGSEQFARQGLERKEREILRVLPKTDPPARKLRVPGGLPAYLASLYEVPLLTRDEEAHLFRKMNYLKCKASVLRAQLNSSQPQSRLMDRIEKLYEESVATKNQIVSANLRLVVSIAKRYAGPTQDFFELVSDGNMSLLRAVDKFDVSRGNKFSTYASWAIMKNFARTIPDALRHRDRFSTSHPEMFSTIEDASADYYDREAAQIQRESQVEKILDRLDERERKIVTSHFGLIRGQEPLTLKQIGATMGVTKERIRQIQVRAMSRLRAAAEEDRIEDAV